MFWQSPSTLLVANSAIPTEGNWAGFWGNEAIDQKLHDIAGSRPVVLAPLIAGFPRQSRNRESTSVEMIVAAASTIHTISQH